MRKILSAIWANIKKLEKMIKKTLSTTDSAHSLYITFNPDLTLGNDEVWYALLNGKITKISVDFNHNKRCFGLPYAEDMAYFFEPQGKKGIWCGPYCDRDIKKELYSLSSRGTVIGIFQELLSIRWTVWTKFSDILFWTTIGLWLLHSRRKKPMH